MNLHFKLKINYWLWMALSIPPILYCWVRIRDVKGWMISDWGYLIFYLERTGYRVTHDIWSFFVETLVWSVVPPLLFGWIAQYLIVLAWTAWHERGCIKKPNAIQNFPN